MAGHGRISSGSGHTSTYMAKRQGKSDRRNRRRSSRTTVARSDQGGASKRETSNSKGAVEWANADEITYSSRIMTKGELLQIIAAFATSFELLDSFPAKCDIGEHGKDGMYLLSIRVHLPQRNRSVSSSLLDQTGKGNS